MTAEGRTISWLDALRRYLLFILLAHLGWEILQLPLYTIAWDGTPGEIAFAVVHCTGGDLLIALSALSFALVVFGHVDWPTKNHIAVTVATVVVGVAYTIFSEWLNLNIRQSWAYADWMPIVPVIDVGLSPLLQWIVIPWAGLVLSCRPMDRFYSNPLARSEETSL